MLSARRLTTLPAGSRAPDVEPAWHQLHSGDSAFFCQQVAGCEWAVARCVW